ncbi:MAG TPA: hypothetical protein VGV92_06290 [Gammaproteobacteria bacterium]|nr:hypothetical protein [Gammaproteobacteria bacterium]
MDEPRDVPGRFDWAAYWAAYVEAHGETIAPTAELRMRDHEKLCQQLGLIPVSRTLTNIELAVQNFLDSGEISNVLDFEAYRNHFEELAEDNVVFSVPATQQQSPEPQRRRERHARQSSLTFFEPPPVVRLLTPDDQLMRAGAGVESLREWFNLKEGDRIKKLGLIELITRFYSNLIFTLKQLNISDEVLLEGLIQERNANSANPQNFVFALKNEVEAAIENALREIKGNILSEYVPRGREPLEQEILDQPFFQVLKEHLFDQQDEAIPVKEGNEGPSVVTDAINALTQRYRAQLDELVRKRVENYGHVPPDQTAEGKLKRTVAALEALQAWASLKKLSVVGKATPESLTDEIIKYYGALISELEPVLGAEFHLKLNEELRRNLVSPKVITFKCEQESHDALEKIFLELSDYIRGKFSDLPTAQSVFEIFKTYYLALAFRNKMTLQDLSTADCVTLLSREHEKLLEDERQNPRVKGSTKLIDWINGYAAPIVVREVDLRDLTRDEQQKCQRMGDDPFVYVDNKIFRRKKGGPLFEVQNNRKQHYKNSVEAYLAENKGSEIDVFVGVLRDLNTLASYQQFYIVKVMSQGESLEGFGDAQPFKSVRTVINSLKAFLATLPEDVKQKKGLLGKVERTLSEIENNLEIIEEWVRKSGVLDKDQLCMLDKTLRKGGFLGARYVKIDLSELEKIRGYIAQQLGHKMYRDLPLLPPPSVQPGPGKK